jgi:hypothetical protein
MAYVPDPTDPTRPLLTDPAGSAAQEFRSLKAYIASLAGLGDGINLFRKNLLDNSQGQVTQRGTSVAALTAAYFLDRWVFVTSSTAVVTGSRAADHPIKGADGFSIGVQVTTADAAVAAGDSAFIAQRIEGYRIARALKQRGTVQLSFWVRSSKTGIHCVFIQSSISDRCYVVEYTINVADTWEYKTIALDLAIAIDAGTWNYTTGIGLIVGWSLMAGATYQAAANLWVNSDRRATANQVNVMDTLANIFRITDVQLEIGSEASPYEEIPFDEDISRCLRYFQKSFLFATAPATNVGVNTGETQWYALAAGAVAYGPPYVPFRQVMRATPTMAFFNPAAANAQARNIGAAADFTLTSAGNVSDRGFLLSATSPGGSVAGNICGAHWTANSEL